MVSLPIEDYLKKYKEEKVLLIDARSEGEFERGHIPGAINIPLLNNEHRVIIGTLYKQKGRQEAVLKGLELVGPLFHSIALKVKELSASNKVMVYCWRGGMRSSIFCWVIGMAGFQASVLKGGYKQYRNWCIDRFKERRELLILGGKTGSGKTEILEAIRQKGEKVICLESMAHHKGSAFGALGQLPQPTQEHFENLLGWELSDKPANEILWLENESRNIGCIKIPDPFFEQMRNAHVLEMEVDRKIRHARILAEYGHFSFEELSDKTVKLQKRMGGQHVSKAIACLADGDKDGWLELLLHYYDKTYSFSNDLRAKELITSVTINWEDKAHDVNKLISLIKVKG